MVYHAIMSWFSVLVNSITEYHVNSLFVEWVCHIPRLINSFIRCGYMSDNIQSIQIILFDVADIRGDIRRVNYTIVE